MKKCSTKLWSVMKLCAAPTILALITCGISLAHENHAQTLDSKITLTIKDVSIEQALHQVQEAGKIKVYFNLESLESVSENHVSLEAVDKRVRDIIDALLSPFRIKYNLDEKNNSVIILRKPPVESVDGTSGIRPFQSRSIQVDEVLTITGVVTEAGSDQPMPGVNIVIKGTTNGTTSDTNGHYTISGNHDDILVFSFIGFASAEIPINSRRTINVSLQEDATRLTEITVNAGYYQTTKELQTGSIVKVDAKDIEKQPVSNPLAALQGRVPGLEVIQQSGVPGGNFKVRIRGTNSLSSGNDPLYIVDGVPYTSSTMSFTQTAGNILGGTDAFGMNPLNSINPADIESIEVLKDADATAIYGSRGANGVILITTKKDNTKGTDIELNFYSGAAHVGNRTNVLGNNDYLQMRNEGYRNDEVEPTPSDAPDLLVWDQSRHTDWQKELIGGPATINDARLSISGGEGNTHFLLGGGFHRETTVFPGSNHDQRISLLSNLHSMSKDERLSVSLSLNMARNATNILSKDLTQSALTLAPNAPAMYDENGKLNWQGWSSSLENPLAYLQRKYESKTSNLIANLTLGYKITKHLEAKISTGFTNIGADAITLNPSSSYHPEQGAINQSIFGRNSFQNWIVEPQMNWTSAVGQGQLNVIVGGTFLDQVTQGLVQYAEGFSSEALMKNIAAAPTIVTATSLFSEYRYQAFFGRANYAWRDKYILNLTGRRDGSSRFGPGNQFAMFGAIGSAWVFSRENFIQSALPFLSFGKLTASYGTTGNDQIGDYQYLDTYSASATYLGQKGLSPARLYNPDFAWEVNRKLEIGLKLGFFNNRLSLNTGWYLNRASNQLVGFPLAPTTGFQSVQGNFPATVQNTGLEFELASINIKQQDGPEWTTSLNLTIPRNTLLKFPDIESSPAYEERYKVGEPLDIVKLYNYQGVDPDIGEYRFADVNQDGMYDISDMQSIRYMGRKLYGGLQNRIICKGFQLDFLFQFVQQEGYNLTHTFSWTPGTLSNQPVHVMQRWTQPGQQGGEIQRFTAGGTTADDAYSSHLYYSTAAVSDASFIRLKNVALSYSFSSMLRRNYPLKDVTLFMQGQNLLTLTTYEGLDPEIPGSGSLPPLRTLTAGCKLKL